MPRSAFRGSPATVPVAVACSAFLHGLVVALGAGILGAGWLSWSNPATPASPVPAAADAPASSPRTIDIDLPDFSQPDRTDSRRSVVEKPPAVPSLPAGRRLPTPDGVRAGRGGSDEARDPAVNLADRDDGIRLARSLASHLDRDQVPRVLSALARQSREDMRLTTVPMELTFLAMGEGSRQERRRPARQDPSNGLPRAGRAKVRGGNHVGAEPLPLGEGAPPRPAGAASLGADVASPGVGVEGASPGLDHRTSAAVAPAKPSVAKGQPSVPANQPGSSSDNVDASQMVASTRQSLTDASAAGGERGEGPGGSEGPGLTGRGGQDGPGSRSSPLGYGPGGYGWSGKDPGLNLYTRHLKAKLYPYWGDAFPRWAIAALRQGRVIIAIEILRDGSVRRAQVTRPSGIHEFDRNCLRAVQKASPFAPIPAALGMEVMRVEIAFDASNPPVR